MKSEGKATLGFMDLLVVAFIALKIAKVIDWSWWWVLSPIWIPLGLVVIVAALYGLVKIFE